MSVDIFGLRGPFSGGIGTALPPPPRPFRARVAAPARPGMG